jgi:hypothetical protein
VVNCKVPSVLRLLFRPKLAEGNFGDTSYAMTLPKTLGPR